jgi:hypothetical protein
VQHRWPCLLLFFAASLLCPRSAVAEHEIYYRYVVLGYVKDAKGVPRSSVEIKLLREKTGLAYYAETDAGGFYLIVVRLEDLDLGNRLRVTADGVTTTIRAKFDPKNRKDERGTRLDFLGPKAVERSTWFAPTLKRSLAR